MDRPSTTQRDRSPAGFGDDSQDRPGRLVSTDGRICLWDLPAGWEAVQRAYFDEVGVAPAYFLYQVGLRIAAAWAPQLAVRAACQPRHALALGLNAIADRGYGAFRIADVGDGCGRVTVMADDSMEAWSHRQRQGRSTRPICSFTSGLLAGLWCMNVAGEPRACNIVCWETECVAMDAPACRFELGTAEDLEAAGLRHPFESRTVRWELQSLSHDLVISQDRLTSVERKLAERESAYQSLLDHMNDHLIVIDRNKRVIFCNRQFLESTGLSLQETIGSSPSERIVPDDWRRVERIYDELITGARETATYIYRAVRPQGVLHFESSARSIRDTDGQIAIEILSRDVSARERAREELASANEALRRAQKATDDDLRVAKHVHESLLPKPVANERIAIDVKYVPAGRVGGDYCQFSFPAPDRCLVSVCDVSGHGTAAALLASHVNSHVRMVSPDDPNPLALVRGINEFLMRHFGSTGLFVTFFALAIDLETYEVEYSGAGHPAPILQRRDGRMEPLVSQNLPVGILDEFVRGKGMDRTQLEPGDRLILYTDGITETRNPPGVLLGTRALETMIAESRSIPFFDLGRHLLERIDTYRGGQSHHDDISLVLIEIPAPNSSIKGSR